MLLQGTAAARFTRNPDPGIWAIVAFGEDEGLAPDAALSIIKAWSGSEPVDVTVLDDEAVRKDPAMFLDALEAVSLLGDKRILRLRTSGDKLAALLTDCFVAADAGTAHYEAKLIVECGSLAKKSKLRVAAEKAAKTACLHLFADEAADIEARVKSALGMEGAAIEADALRLFVGDLPGNRLAANSEIEKLALYARGLGRAVSVADIRALCATEFEQDLSSAIDATFQGKPDVANTMLDRLALSGTSGISILRSMQFEVHRMMDAHARIEEGQASPNMKLRPPVWQSEWPSYRARLQRWPVKRLARVLERIYDAEAQAKRAGGSADASVRILMIAIARAAEAAR